jgi:hypothetical protein
LRISKPDASDMLFPRCPDYDGPGPYSGAVFFRNRIFMSAARESRTMNWREHIAAVLGAVLVLAVVAAVAVRPLFVNLSSPALKSDFSTTIAKTLTPPREDAGFGLTESP